MLVLVGVFGKQRIKQERRKEKGIRQGRYGENKVSTNMGTGRSKGKGGISGI